MANVLDTYSEEEFQEYYLISPKLDLELRADLASYVPGMGNTAYRASAMMCGEVGELRANHMLVLVDSLGQTIIGQAVFFARCSSYTLSEECHLIAFRKYMKVNDLEWAPARGKLSIAPSPEARCSVPYVHADGDRIVPFLPSEKIMSAY